MPSRQVIYKILLWSSPRRFTTPFRGCLWLQLFSSYQERSVINAANAVFLTVFLVLWSQSISLTKSYKLSQKKNTVMAMSVALCSQYSVDDKSQIVHCEQKSNNSTKTVFSCIFFDFVCQKILCRYLCQWQGYFYDIFFANWLLHPFHGI